MSTMELPASRRSLGAPLHRVLNGLRPVMHRALTRSWPETALSPSQARVLRIVRLCPGISTLDLATELREDPTLAAAIAAELIAMDLLEARGTGEDDDDGLRLTHRGRVRTVAWVDNGRAVLDRALDTLSQQDRAAIALALPALEHLAAVLADS